MAGTADMIEETSSKGYDRPAASGKSVPNGVESEHRPFLEPVRQRSPRRQRQQSAVATLQVEKATEGGGIPGPTEAVLWAAGWFRSSKNRTSMLVNLSAIMERTDEQLLPAVYLFVAAAFRATPEQLGYLTLSRALVQAIASPLGGFLGHYYNRIWVIALGCTIWGIMTAGFAFCTTIHQGYFFWAVNGIGLSMVIPNGQSLTADYYPEASRGKAFGALYLTGAFGAMLGALYATNLGCLQPLGMEGWRFAFLSVAILSLAIGVLTFLFGHDPRFTTDKHIALPKAEAGQAPPSFLQLLKETKNICIVPTFIIIITQGILGSTPWNALVFFTLYLQLLGMSDAASSSLMAVFLGGTALGGLLGGWVGDKAAQAYPLHGRILVCQYSVISGVPFSLLLLKGLPYDGGSETVFWYGVVLFLMGLSISWAAPACNNPIFAEIVPSHMRNMIYAFDRSFEGAIAACGAPLVGILAERYFHFVGTATSTTHCDSTTAAAPPGVELEEVSQNVGKAHALGDALVVALVVPWGLCFIFYSGMHFTYPLDRRKALAAEALARQLDGAGGSMSLAARTSEHEEANDTHEDLDEVQQHASRKSGSGNLGEERRRSPHPSLR